MKIYNWDMYIPLSIIAIIVIVYAIYAYGKKAKRGLTIDIDGETMNVDEMWNKAGLNEKSSKEWNTMEQDRHSDVIQKMNDMKLKVLTLKEKFKHDPQMQLTISRDWMDYTDALYEIMQITMNLDAASGKEETDFVYEQQDRAHITVSEIEKRVGKLLKD